MPKLSTEMTDFKMQMKGMGFVALSGTLFGLMGFLGTTLVAKNFSVVNMLFWRFFVAMLAMVLMTLIFNRTIISKLNLKLLSKTFLISTLSYSGGSAFYFYASEHIGTGIAMVVFFSFPVFVTFFACIFDKWKLNRYTVISLLIVTMGLICLKGESNNAVNLIGILFAISAALSYAIYVYSNRHHSRSLPPSLLTIAVCLGNTILFLLLSLYTHTFYVPENLHTWVYICAIGIIATAMPIQFLLYGLKYTSPVKASILSVLEPIVTVLIGLFFLDERLTFMQTLGIFIVLIGALVIQFEKIPQSKVNISP